MTGSSRDRAARVLSSRLVRLAARIAVAAGTTTIALLVAGRGAAGPALATGAATWLVLTSWPDLRALASGAQPGSGPVATGRDRSADQADQEPT